MEASLEQLEHRLPYIKWRQPVYIKMFSGEGWYCRVCVAVEGIKGDEPEKLFPSEEDVRKHIKEVHT